MTYAGDPWAAAGVREGEILAGKYRVDRVLGAGGMGLVVAAHHLGLDSRVAIKFLLPEMLTHKDSPLGSRRRQAMAARITNEHVARVFDVGVLEDGAPYMVMEYLDGADLGEWLRREAGCPSRMRSTSSCRRARRRRSPRGRHRPSQSQAREPVLRRAVRRLALIKVLDFGVSKATLPGAVSGNLAVTSATSLLGSPFYMSPEQMESGNSVDARTDVWAMGVILSKS